jgi:hypothetical protein
MTDWFHNFFGTMKTYFQVGGPGGSRLRSNSGLEVRNNTGSNYTTLRADRIQDTNTINDIPTLLDLQARIADIEFSFDGVSPPSPGDNTSKFGFCHTTGGSYTAGQIVYDNGAILIVIPTDLVKSITSRDLIEGDTNILADSLYILEGGSWTLKRGSGWIKIYDVTASGGTITNKVYQDGGNTILQSCKTSQLGVTIWLKSSYPLVTVDGVDGQLTQDGDGGHYSGSVSTTLGAAQRVFANCKTPDGGIGVYDSVYVNYDPPPEILTLQFTGGYPGAQTELKAGDTFQISGTTDKAIDGIDIADFGAFDASFEVESGTAFLVTGTIADRGTTLQALAAKVRARDAVSGAYGPYKQTNDGGGTTDGVHLVNLNNLYPTVSWGSPSYPPTQQALKDSEQATVPITISNADTISFTSPNGHLSITNPTTIETPKTVTRIGGNYNISANNLRAEANRAANDADTVDLTVVNIAHTAASINVNEPAARLRSGGNDGTSIQNHTISIVSDQQLISTPSLSEDTGGGTFIGSWVGGPTTYTRTLQVHDDDVKGVYTWQSLSATNLANKVTTVITGNATYELGGFVSRTITWDAFQTISRNVNVAIADFSKVQAGLWSATNNQSIKYVIGTSPPKTDGYTSQQAVGNNPHNVIWLDTTAAGSNSGEAYLFSYEEVV